MGTTTAGSFADYRDRHRGETVVVCGCGPSLALLSQPQRCVTIGVNDVGCLFTPDYLVVLNERRQFDRQRYVHVEQSQAKAVFSQLQLQHPRAVQFRLGRRGGTERPDGHSLHYTANSPYVAVHLARHMGARRIGLVGVDLCDGHPLAAQRAHIDAEYAALQQACDADGVELVNLSPSSRLSALPRATLAHWLPQRVLGCRVFFVHYRFLSCGTVFDTGLREAAQTLGLATEHADWDDPQLPQKIERCRPDLLFVVHGRRFVQRWGRRFAAMRSAVWLVDEPYEVDDTAAWSGHFTHVFVNDAATLARHRNAHALPVAYAPLLHHAPVGTERRHRVGFIGGANPARERLLAGLAGRGLLDYVVGGPWREAALGAVCLAGNVPAEQAAALYRDTDIVINVFRDRHHFNRDGLVGTAMNPRVCEALACGALVLSEPRAELLRDVPELPVFRSEAEAAALVTHFLSNPAERSRVQQLCAARLRDATYAHRLRTVMGVTLETMAAAAAPTLLHPRAARQEPRADLSELPTQTAALPGPAPVSVTAFNAEWDDLGSVVQAAGSNDLVIDPGPQRGPGLERGLASRVRFDAADLSFEASLEPGASLLAKLHQADRIDQSTNSYHLLVEERRAYLARHQHVFRQLDPPRQAGPVLWRLVCQRGLVSLWRNGQLLHRVRDAALAGGYAFLGAQGGRVHLRNVQLLAADAPRPRQAADVHVLQAVAAPTPRLSIVTTVYDRVDCLRQCIASVQRLAFRDLEHLVVADHPPPEVLARIQAVVAQADDPRIGLFDLPQRHNNWGIAPAAAGLRMARGEYLSFLSDDNGYTPDHADALMRVLDREPMLGFVYSSCQYDGRLVLSHPVPRPGRIDLGQPMFRRELFELHLNDDLPFDMMAWDWHLVDTLMRRGVRWRHVDRQSFLFRLAKYPRWMAA